MSTTTKGWANTLSPDAPYPPQPRKDPLHALDAVIGRLNESMRSLKSFTPADYETVQMLRDVFDQLESEAVRCQIALRNAAEEAKLRRASIYSSVDQFYPHPIAHCGFCEKPIYAQPAPQDPTASLCDNCHTQLTALILAAPMLSNAILSAMRLQGALK